MHFGGPSEYVILADTSWQPRDSFPIPRRLRRGIPLAIDYDVSGGRNIYDVKRQLSQPFRLSHLSGGRYAAFHLDASIVNNTNITGRAFMTVISPAGATRCVDVPVPTRDSTTIPRLSLVGDTLFVLDHFAVADSAIAEVSKYWIESDVC